MIVIKSAIHYNRDIEKMSEWIKNMVLCFLAIMQRGGEGNYEYVGYYRSGHGRTVKFAYGGSGEDRLYFEEADGGGNQERENSFVRLVSCHRERAWHG